MKLPAEKSCDEKGIVVSGPLRGYFFGICIGDQGEAGRGISGFAFPDLGILFKSRCGKQLFECQYEGLLALLMFTEEYPEIFKDLDLELFTDSAVVSFQMNNRREIPGALKEYRDKALSYRQKIKYKIGWVPFHENLAIRGYDDMTTIGPDIDMEIGECRLIDKKQLMVIQDVRSE
jgi:hypothetical protein